MRILSKLIPVACSAFAFAASLSAVGATPQIDPTFAGGQAAAQMFLSLGGMAGKPFVQRDGRIIVAGYYIHGFGGRGAIPLAYGAMVRHMPDGSLDASYGDKGVVDKPTISPRALLRDGRIVGLGEQGLARYNVDGSIDTTLDAKGAAGIAWYPQFGGYLLEQADGKIVGVGSVGAGEGIVTLLRFNPGGSLDPTFNNVGAVIAPRAGTTNDYIAGAALKPDGSILAAATSTANGKTVPSVLRFLPDGRPDTSFGEGGRAIPSVDSATERFYLVHALVAQPNGRIVLVAKYVDDSSNRSGILLIGLTASGALDPAFGAGGIVRYMPGADGYVVEVWDTLVQPDGRILVLLDRRTPTTDSQPAIVAIAPDGSIDTSFGIAGAWTVSGLKSARGMALTPDGRLVLTGEAANGQSYGDFAVARYLMGASPVIEYYNVALDHYFITMNPFEASDLDLGVHSGWARTTASFRVYGTALDAPSGFVPVCRFYIPPQHGDSHFFSASSSECASVVERMASDPNYSGYAFESPSAFQVALPDLASGACPAATVAVYRLWNQRADSNHRYVINPAVKAQMIAKGYVAEGYGPDAVAMCAATQ